MRTRRSRFYRQAFQSLVVPLRCGPGASRSRLPSLQSNTQLVVDSVAFGTSLQCDGEAIYRSPIDGRVRLVATKSRLYFDRGFSARNVSLSHSECQSSGRGDDLV